MENVGWMIPTCIVEHFLQDFLRHGAYTGFPCLGIRWQNLENDALRRHMQLPVRPPSLCFAGGIQL